MKRILKEDKYDSVVRTIVRDILTIFRDVRKGEFGLPEDLDSGEIEYEFPQLQNSISVFLDLKIDDSVDGFDADADYYNDEDLIYVTIVSNPSYGNNILQPLVGELNELIRHELEHVKQYEQGYKFPKKEPKNPEKYYSQTHELDAQKAGFTRRARKEKLDYETLVRRWFLENKHKHKMNPEQAERVIQKLLAQR